LLLFALPNIIALLLTPPFPPTGFLGQDYQLRFQASGLIKPVFTFEGLPPFLTGFGNGTVAGTPDALGCFNIVVKYSDKTHNGSQEAVICMATNSTDGLNLNPQTQSLNSPLYISPSVSSWMFQVGQQIEIGFECINSVAPVVSSFMNLPV
jgi:hypothetical protein